MDNSDLKLIKKTNTVNLLKIAAKAGKICFGEDNSLNAIRSRKAKLLLLNSECSANTRKRFLNSCDYYNLPIMQFDPGELDVASALGKSHVKIIALCDEGFYKRILEIENITENSDRAIIDKDLKSGVMG